MAGSQQRKEEWDCWILEASDMTGRHCRQWLLSDLRPEHRENRKRSQLSWAGRATSAACLGTHGTPSYKMLTSLTYSVGTCVGFPKSCGKSKKARICIPIL